MICILGEKFKRYKSIMVDHLMGFSQQKLRYRLTRKATVKESLITLIVLML